MEGLPGLLEDDAGKGTCPPPVPGSLLEAVGSELRRGSPVCCRLGVGCGVSSNETVSGLETKPKRQNFVRPSYLPCQKRLQKQRRYEHARSSLGCHLGFAPNGSVL